MTSVRTPDGAASVVATKASELPVPTFEASVSCGAWCQGGSVSFEATTYPEYADLSEVWVRGTDVAALASSHADLLAALDILIANARLIPDPGMAGATDCYAVPMDDIEAARAAIARATGERK